MRALLSAPDRPITQLKERYPDDRPAPLWLAVLLVLSYTGAVTLRLQLPLNMTHGDFAIGAVVLVGLVSMSTRGSLAVALLRRALPWMVSIIVGALLGLHAVGMHGWAISSLARLFVAFLAFFTFLHLFLRVQGLIRYGILALWIAWGMSVFGVVVLDGFDGWRASGLFRQPNYLGHFIVPATTLLFALSRHVVTKLLLLAGLGICLYGSASFGAMVMVLAITTTLLVRLLGRRGLTVLVLLLSAVGFVMLATVDPYPDIDDGTPVERDTLEVSDTISEDRFDRSRGDRLELWGAALAFYVDSPLGVGPAGIENREIAERRDRGMQVHSDILNYLIERGPLGLVGLIGFWVVVWRAAPAGGVARLLMVSYFAAGALRNTMHYRHLWLILALALAVDLYQRRVRVRPEDWDEPEQVGPETGLTPEGPYRSPDGDGLRLGGNGPRPGGNGESVGAGRTATRVAGSAATWRT